MPKRPTQHRIRDNGIDQFRKSLPSNEKSEHLFANIPQEYDYGIDGFTQIFNGELHTGEIYQVQIKASKNATITQKGVIIFSLDVDKAKFYIEQLKEPLVFILADTAAHKTYWHDIQISERTLELFQRAKAENANYVNIEINPNYTLPETFEEYCEYIKKASARLNKQGEIDRISKASLSKAVEEIMSYEGETLSLKGYDIFQGKELTPEMRDRLVFSTINQQTGKEIHYLANKEYTQDDAIQIQSIFTFPINTEEGKIKAQELQDVLNGKIDFAEIPSKYVRNLSSFTANRTIHNSTGEYSIRIGVSTNESELHLKSRKTDEEVRLRVLGWVSRDNKIKLDSSSFLGQPLIFKMSLNLVNNRTNLHYELNNEKLKNVADAYFYINFLEDFKIDGEIFAYVNNIKRVFAQINVAKSKNDFENDPHIKLLKKLVFIQEKTQSFIPYPFPDIIDKKELESIHTLYLLLKEGRVKCSYRTRVKQNNIAKIGEEISFFTQYENYTIFGININLPTKHIKFTGLVSKLTLYKNFIELEVKAAEMSFNTEKKS